MNRNSNHTGLRLRGLPGGMQGVAPSAENAGKASRVALLLGPPLARAIASRGVRRLWRRSDGELPGEALSPGGCPKQGLLEFFCRLESIRWIHGHGFLNGRGSRDGKSSGCACAVGSI